MRRTIWDGAQQLGEIQVPCNLEHGAFFEADSFITPLSKSDAPEAPNPYYGRVIYTPGLIIDQPVVRGLKAALGLASPDTPWRAPYTRPSGPVAVGAEPGLQPRNVESARPAPVRHLRRRRFEKRGKRSEK